MGSEPTSVVFFSRWVAQVDSLIQNFRYTARKLLRAPLFSIVAVSTLAVGIGSNAAIFSIVNGVLLKPLAFEDPDRLVGIWHTAPGLNFDILNQSPALHCTYLEQGTQFESVGMWDDAQASVTGLAEPEQVSAMHVTHQTLPILGIQPILGRVFSEEDDLPGAPETVLLLPRLLGTSLRIGPRGDRSHHHCERPTPRDHRHHARGPAIPSQQPRHLHPLPI